MSKHVLHVIKVIVIQVVLASASLPFSPAVKTFVEHHPALAVYLPVVTALWAAVVAAARKEEKGA